jgi:acetyltransferase-like isoleucine patch superfamily enzyme
MNRDNAMKFKVIAGALLAYGYNHWVGTFPSRRVREIYLRVWLGHFGGGSGVQMGCRFLNGRKVFLGERNVINFGCLLDGRKFQIRTGSNVSIGPEATILTLGHDPRSPVFADRGGDVLIGDRVWIGYGAIILPGVKIGQGAVVGAGAVVTKNVEPYSIMVGNPARKIGERTVAQNVDKCDEHVAGCAEHPAGGLGFEYELEYQPWLL